MKKILTKKQKEKEAILSLKKIVRDKILTELLKRLKTTLKNDNLPKNWLELDSKKIEDFILYDFFDKKPFEPVNEIKKNEFNQFVKN